MKIYSEAVKSEAKRLFDSQFNDLNFELLKKAEGEENITDLIIKPSDDIILKEWLNKTQDKVLLVRKFEKTPQNHIVFDTEKIQRNEFYDWLNKKYADEIDEWWFEHEHYPMWGTIFEAKDKMLSDGLIEKADKLYDLGIGILRETDYTNACLFIAGAGYDFYSAHWIPLFIFLGWLNPDEIDKEKETFENTETNKPELIDWSKFTDILIKYSRNKDETIKRHAEGLLKALKL